jgi:hypothetical protein
MFDRKPRFRWEHAIVTGALGHIRSIVTLVALR